MERYYKFSKYLKDSGYDRKILKLTVDAGFSCPNRDGKISYDGCIYCNNEGFSPNTRSVRRSIKEQIEHGISFTKHKYKNPGYIVYFQAFTNTYAPVSELKQVYDGIKTFPDVVGLAIGTRPDCVNIEALELINSYAKDYDVWLEYGLQSVHDKTLKKINRGHTCQDFLKAVELTRKYERIKICAHIVIGLPGEDKDEIIQTAKTLGELKIDGIKIHPLHVIKNTKLEKLYDKGGIKPLAQDEYIELAVNFLEHLWPQTVIQRISADCQKGLLVAPLWLNDKSKILNGITKLMEEKGTFQGKRWNE